MINDLVKELEQKGISSSIVIGKDSKRNVLDYSKHYETSILVDSDGVFFDKVGANGVPYFAVSDKKGKRISHMSGGYTTVERMRDKLNI